MTIMVGVFSYECYRGMTMCPDIWQCGNNVVSLCWCFVV